MSEQSKNTWEEAPQPAGDTRERPTIEPLFNEAFIRIFGRQESKGITRSLINAVLAEAGMGEIGEIDEISAEHGSPEGGVECKTPRFDVHVVADSRHVDVEAQRETEYIGNRSVYYAANMLVAATGKVGSYGDLPQAIVITLLDDPSPFDGAEGFVRTCRWHWDTEAGPEAPDRQLIILVELGKVRAKYNMLDEGVLGDKFLSWTYLITNGFKEESAMQEIAQSYPDIEEFAELYGLAVNDPKVVRAYWDAKTAVLEYDNRQAFYANMKKRAEEEGHSKGFQQGIEQGIEQGIAQGAERMSNEIAARLRARGLSEAEIHEIVGA